MEKEREMANNFQKKKNVFILENIKMVKNMEKEFNIMKMEIFFIKVILLKESGKEMVNYFQKIKNVFILENLKRVIAMEKEYHMMKMGILFIKVILSKESLQVFIKKFNMKMEHIMKEM